LHEFIKSFPNHKRGLESPADVPGSLREEEPKIQVEVLGRSHTYFIILPRASLPALLGQEGEALRRAAWLGA